MIKYKAGYKYVTTGVHAQVLDFPAAITCASDLNEARRALAEALVDVAEAAVESGDALPSPNPAVSDPRWTLKSRSICTSAPAPRSLRFLREWSSRETQGPVDASAAGCRLLREGGGHSVWINPANRQQSAIPRHREIDDYTARAICRQLGVPEP